MVWIEGETMPKMHRHEGFLMDLATELSILHSSKERGDLKIYPIPEIGSNLERDNRMWLDSNSFVESAIDEFQEIWKKLNNRCVLHGDLWNENIIVNEEGRLAGLIDWEHSCVYDPHWEFRMIRRFIGWDGLEMLLYYYNRKSIFTLEFNIIKTLDKFWMCHQYIHRLKKSDSNAALFLEYIEKWPNCLYEISNNYIQRE